MERASIATAARPRDANPEPACTRLGALDLATELGNVARAAWTVPGRPMAAYASLVAGRSGGYFRCGAKIKNALTFRPVYSAGAGQ